MVRLSARCTHPDGNRRYEDFIFMVEGNRVVSITIEGELLAVDEALNFKCMTCRDTNQVRVFDQCEYCDGVGCTKCDKGLVLSTIKCPTCEQNRKMSTRY